MLRMTVEPPKPVKIQNEIIFPYKLSDESLDQLSSTALLDDAGEGGSDEDPDA